MPNIMSKKLRASNVENNLYSTLDIEEDIDALSYTDLPAFEQKVNGSYQTVIVHTRTKEDLEALAKFLDQPNIMLDGKRTNKSVWYPKLGDGERGQNSLVVWMDEDEPSVQKLMGSTK